MEDNIGSIIDDNNMNRKSQYQKEKITKFEFYNKNKKKSLYLIYSNVINFILFEIISILLPKTIFSINFMEIKVNQIGYNQILSDNYNGILPIKVCINSIPKLLRNRKVYVESIDDLIYLEWPASSYKIDVTYMFSNLTSITSVRMNIFGIDGNMSYMFYNCNNLEQFTYTFYNNKNYIIKDMRSMFYNCYFLKSFDFSKIYLDFHTDTPRIVYNKTSKKNETVHYYYYYDINLSSMFYNCKSLESVNFGKRDISKIIDMNSMFYNCHTIKSINLTNFLTSTNVNISYMFYNCSNLSIFTYKPINIKDMKYTFYNCTLLNQINIDYFRSYSAAYYINMSNVFYNCIGLSTISGGFNYLYINDAREIFYNCISLKTLNFNPKGVAVKINMTKMLYNCTKLESIELNNKNLSIFPNDLSYAFYNCTSLTSLKFKNFTTDNLEEIKYMMFNCKELKNFKLENSSFSNLLTKNMRGVFQNCSSLTSIDLTFFSTKNVEVMWDMFKGCSKLRTLTQKFDTSKVVDMESMFEGCSSFSTLNLNTFRTPKVHYMNKMFSGCTSLQTLLIRYITSNELGTMHQMFYNCKKLTTLDIYSLNENDQSIFQMFEGASENFKFCIQDDSKIPKIFKLITSFPGTSRDCSSSCYGTNNERVSILGQKLCCAKFEYNGRCCDKCPPRTIPVSSKNKSCINFTCDYYYNYTQDGCWDKVPDGYYENDTTLRIVDKCPGNCKTCIKKPEQKRVHCLTCSTTGLRFLYFGNCTSSCPNGFYNNSGVLTCKCVTKECSDCTEESLELGLCISCAAGYYIKSDDKFDKYIKCYKEPAKYYYSSSLKQFLPCYHSCQNCYGAGTKAYHNCITCDSDNKFYIEKKRGVTMTKNCYKKCDYYYYFDSNNDYLCTKKKECPSTYQFLIVELRQCVESCDGTYPMQLRKECYKECPPGKSKKSIQKTNICLVICPYDSPFELIKDQSCVASCSIMERSEKLCVTNNVGNRTNLLIQEIIHNDIISDLTNKFNYTILTDNYSVIIEEKNTTYEIITTDNKNKNILTSNIEFGECEKILREYYGIDENELLYYLKMDTYIEGKTGPTVVYELFYPLDSKNLVQLDISICEGKQVEISYYMELENPELYDKNNPIYNDICHPYTSVDGLDMTLSGKQKDYANNNKSLCEENCEYTGYDKINKLVKCNCDIKDSTEMISDIKVDKSKLYDFMSIDKLANFDVLKCVNLVMKIENLIINIGFYSFIPAFICYFLAIIIFYKKDWKFLKKKINEFVLVKKNLEYLKKRREEILKNGGYPYERPIIYSILKKKKMKKSKFFTSNNNIPNARINNIFNKHKKIISTKPKPNETIEEKITEEDISQYNSTYRLNKLENNKNKNNNQNDIIIIKKKTQNAPPLKTQIITNKKFGKNNLKIFNKKRGPNFLTEIKDCKMLYSKIRKIDEIIKEEKKMRLHLRKNDKELNELNFKFAVKFDSRTFWQYYFSLLKTDHLLVKVINSKDYNSRIIKLYLFLYNFGLAYAVNGLFFDDAAIDQIFEDGGEFDFINQIPQIIYSSIISFAFCVILDYLALTEDTLLEIKSEIVASNAEQKAKDAMRILPIKFIFFFILSFLFMLICWYYITCFCAVYKNTQFYLLKDTLISFGISIMSPFLAKLITGIFRIYSLRRRSQILFRMSQFTQMLV